MRVPRPHVYIYLRSIYYICPHVLPSLYWPQLDIVVGSTFAVPRPVTTTTRRGCPTRLHYHVWVILPYGNLHLDVPRVVGTPRLPDYCRLFYTLRSFITFGLFPTFWTYYTFRFTIQHSLPPLLPFSWTFTALYIPRFDFPLLLQFTWLVTGMDGSSSCTPLTLYLFGLTIVGRVWFLCSWLQFLCPLSHWIALHIRIGHLDINHYIYLPTPWFPPYTLRFTLLISFVLLGSVYRPFPYNYLPTPLVHRIPLGCHSFAHLPTAAHSRYPRSAYDTGSPFQLNILQWVELPHTTASVRHIVVVMVVIWTFPFPGWILPHTALVILPPWL